VTCQSCSTPTTCKLVYTATYACAP
jgi:hypothetical protein